MAYKTIQLNSGTSGSSPSSVLVIYTGGTLGMIYDSRNKQLIPFEFEHIIDRIPEIRSLDFQITFLTLDEPIDSSNMTPDLWVEMAKLISMNYAKYDSFVILHGTDTMAYTASALSFLLENLTKPVILTGAQLPIGIARSDARENIITALEIASAKDADGKPVVSEVCIYFNSLLLRGNRAKKKESSDFNAFQSDNYPVLARAGVRIEYYLPYLWAGTLPDAPLNVHSKMDRHVTFLKIFPGMSQEVVQSILRLDGLRGVVMETFGAGNAPTSGWFLEEIRAAVARKLHIVNVSQCDGGRVTQGEYQTSKYLQQAGVISGTDCTAEAAITKMMFVLGQVEEYGQQVEMLKSPLRGEMSS